MASTATGEKGVNLVWLAQSRLRRRKYDECIDLCTELLDKNPYDQVSTNQAFPSHIQTHPRQHHPLTPLSGKTDMMCAAGEAIFISVSWLFYFCQCIHWKDLYRADVHPSAMQSVHLGLRDVCAAVQGAWYLKARALSLKNWIDDTEIEEEGIAELLLDDNAVASVARPGTSLARPHTNAGVSFSPHMLPSLLHCHLLQFESFFFKYVPSQCSQVYSWIV
jgi:hypothetical protein